MADLKGNSLVTGTADLLPDRAISLHNCSKLSSFVFLFLFGSKSSKLLVPILRFLLMSVDLLGQ